MSEVEIILGTDLDCREDEAEEKMLAAEAILIAARSTVSFEGAKPVVEFKVAGAVVESLVPPSCPCPCADSATGCSERAFKQNDTVNGVISVIQSSNRRLLEGSEEEFKERLDEDLIETGPSFCMPL